MKAYFIDTPNKQITEVDWDGDYMSINRWISAGIYTVVRLNEAYDVMFVDDEGLINGNPFGWIVYEGYSQPLRGYGFVLGTDEVGESIAPRMSIDELRTKVTFPEDSELKAPEEYADVQIYTGEEALRHMGLL